MDILNVEIKAKIDHDHFHFIKDYLDNHCTVFSGIDHQADYYFNVPNGRLKLRTGNIEQSLIFYDRQEDKLLKTSRIKLYKPVERPEALLDTLEAAYGIKVKVTKARMIYFIDHVKFHLDKIEGLGYFCEIEVISTNGIFTKSELTDTCKHYIEQLNITKDMMVQESYSDMLLKNS